MATAIAPTIGICLGTPGVAGVATAVAPTIGICLGTPGKSGTATAVAPTVGIGAALLCTRMLTSVSSE